MPDVTLHFPAAGVDVSAAFCKQPNRPAYQDKYARTTPVGYNCRSFDRDRRQRGGLRPGLSKYVSARVNGDYIVQGLGTLVTTGDAPGGATVQGSQSGRLVLAWAVSQGTVSVLPAGETAWVTPTNETGQTPALNATGLVYGANNNQLVFFADGTNAVYYDPVTNKVKLWTLTAGTFPEDSEGNLPRLICTWRGRTVLAGLLDDPSVIFMSKVSDPFDFNYAPAVPVPPDSAWSGHVGPQGETGDVITALIPYTDDVLIIGQDSSLALFRGDPNYGGSIDNVTSTIGIAWGQAWCMDPAGVVYFFSNRTGVFGYVPGNQPLRISQAIDTLMLDIDTGQYVVRLLWNDRFKGLHVFVTLLSTRTQTRHFFWEQQANAWWVDTFGSTALNPLCCTVFDGNQQTDRVSLIGSWDGYVRSVSSDAEDDDGTLIESEVWIGPFLTQFSDAVILHEIQAVLGASSGDVNYEVYVGDTAEEALASDPVATGTWSAGRNFTDTVRRAGYAAYIRLTSTNVWAMEGIRCLISDRGLIRRRGK